MQKKAERGRKRIKQKTKDKEHFNQQRQNIFFLFFSRTHGAVTKIAPILGHKTIDNKFKETKITKIYFLTIIQLK